MTKQEFIDFVNDKVIPKSPNDLISAQDLRDSIIDAGNYLYDRLEEINVTGLTEQAESAKGTAETKASEAATSANDAVTAKNDAVTAKNTAVTAKNDAVAAKDAAITAKNDAISAKNDAITSASSIANSNANAIATANNALAVANTATLQGVRLGVWNPNTNTQNLTTDASAIIAGGFYDVTTAGTSSITGTSTTFQIGDRLAKVANVWVRLPFSINSPIFFQPDDIITALSYIVYPNAGTTYTNTNNVLTAVRSDANYGVVTTALEANNIIFNFQDWICIGYNSAGLPIILSLDSNRGKIQTITSTGGLGGINGTVYFSTTVIPANAIVRITNNNDKITVHYSIDNQGTWTFWAENTKVNLGIVSTKFGALKLFPLSVISIDYSNNIISSPVGASIVESSIVENTNVQNSDKIVLLTNTAKSGIRKINAQSFVQQLQQKNLVLKPKIPVVTFKGFPVESEFSYVNGYLTATGGNFSTAISNVELDNIVFNVTDNSAWFVIGQDNLGSIILSTKTNSIGDIRRISATKGLSGTYANFSTNVAIPNATTAIKIDVSTSFIVVFTTINGTTWTEWGRILKSSVSNSYTKRLGVINISNAVAVVSAQPNVTESTTTYSIDASNVAENSNSTDYVMLLNPTEPSGVRKRKIADIFSLYSPNSSSLLQEIPPNFTKIIAVGTSITYGVGATGGNAGTSKWVSVAQQGLTDALGRNITIVNGGISGQLTTGMLSNLPALLSANADASIVILEAGVNDAKYAPNGIDIATTKSNLQSMITLVKNAGMIPILSTPAPLDMSNSGVSSGFDNAKRTAICLATVALAKSNNIRCADINKHTSQNVDLLADGLHPNDKGHLAWANIICSEILK